MNPPQLYRLAKGLAFIVMFFVIVVWMLQPAPGGEITGGFLDFEPQHVSLSTWGDQEADDFAIWGTYDYSRLWASYGKYQGLEGEVAHPLSYALLDMTNRNPLRALGPFETGNTYTANNLYGGLQHDGQEQRGSNNGEGFAVTVHADGSDMQVNIWGDSYLGQTTLTIYNGWNRPIEQTYGRATLEDQPFLASYNLRGVTGDVMFSFAFTNDASGDLHSGNLSLAAAQVVSIPAVPEPSTFALLIAAATTLLFPKFRRPAWC
jgi:hypothetical protein